VGLNDLIVNRKSEVSEETYSTIKDKRQAILNFYGEYYCNQKPQKTKGVLEFEMQGDMCEVHPILRPCCNTARKSTNPPAITSDRQDKKAERLRKNSEEAGVNLHSSIFAFLELCAVSVQLRHMSCLNHSTSSSSSM
jgi:hypothetical protein